MRWIFVPLIAGLITASYAGSPQIPPAEKPFAVCLYKALKSTPGITGVDVYVLKKAHPAHPDIVLSYGYRNAKGADMSSDIVLTLPPAGRYEYVGDFTQPDNPVNKAFRALDTACGIDSGYVDQVFLTDPSERVDMGD